MRASSTVWQDRERAGSSKAWRKGKCLSSGCVRGWILLLLGSPVLHCQSFQESSELRSPFFLLISVRPLLLYILLLHSSWPSTCWSYRLLLKYLSHPTISSTYCELQQTRWHCSRVIPSLMRPDCQLRAFNAEVTNSSIIAHPPCPHSYPLMLVLSFGMTRRVALDGVLLFPSMTSVCQGEDGPRQCLPAALRLP